MQNSNLAIGHTDVNSVPEAGDSKAVVASAGTVCFYRAGLFITGRGVLTGGADKKPLLL